MKDIATIDGEAKFELNELFISQTDKKGLIQSGNAVFVRVSGYAKSDLIGKPHNIIRHPDMPRAVFKVFWDYLNRNEIIAAYVKNRAIDGRYYWVFATVFPTANGYFSIRLKPSSELFAKITELYSVLHTFEAQNGMDATGDQLVEGLKSLGFSSYTEFMYHALGQELQSRDQKLSGTLETRGISKTSVGNRFQEMQDLLANVAQQFQSANAKLVQFQDLKNIWGEHQESFVKAFHRLETLPVNMTITAKKMGKEGSSLAIVASTYQNTAQLTSRKFDDFKIAFSKVIEQLDQIQSSLLVSRVQIEMLRFHFGELVTEFGRNIDPRNLRDCLLETTELLNSATELLRSNNRRQTEFYQMLVQLNKDTTILQELVIRLDLIRVGGKLEGSRTIEIDTAFRPFVKDMNHVIKTVDAPLREMLMTLQDFCANFSSIVSGGSVLDLNLQEIVALHSSLQNPKSGPLAEAI